jgi:hypothetical protein
VRESFDAVVVSLASQVEVGRLTGAILLRRFFDSQTEVGIAGTPYWKEAVNVTAAVLRVRIPATFRLLADGLAFAPSMAGVDLQRKHKNAGVHAAIRDSRGLRGPTVLRMC